MEIQEFRDLLGIACENTANWRDRKAAEYPDDIRNRHSADALRGVAKELRTLPPNHAGLIRLWNLCYGPRTRASERRREDDALHGIETESECIRTYGFSVRAIKPNAEEFLARYASELQAQIGRR